MSNILSVVPKEGEIGILYISEEDENFPYLAYNNGSGVVSILCESSREGLLRCSELKEALTRFINRGTRFIIGDGYDGNDQKLYYLNPAYNSGLSNIKGNKLLPYVPTSSLVRPYPKAFYSLDEINQRELNSIILTSNKPEDIVEVDGSEMTGEEADLALLNNLLKKTVDSYKEPQPDFPPPLKDIKKDDEETYNEIIKPLVDINYKNEIRNWLGKYSRNVINNQSVFEIMPKSSYTDTIDLNFIINKLSGVEITATANLGISYSTGGKIIKTMISFEIFKYDEESELVIKNQIFDKGVVQAEYLNGVVRVFPNDKDVTECIISNCLVIYGKL